MESGESHLKLAMKRAALDAWVEIIGGMMAFAVTDGEELYSPVSGGRCHLTGRDYPEQPVPKYDEVWGGQSARSFVLVFGSDGIHLLVCAPLRTYANYPRAEEEKLAKWLCLQEVAIRSSSFFVGHGYLNHGDYC